MFHLRSAEWDSSLATAQPRKKQESNELASELTSRVSFLSKAGEGVPREAGTRNAIGGANAFTAGTLIEVLLKLCVPCVGGQCGSLASRISGVRRV